MTFSTSTSSIIEDFPLVSKSLPLLSITALTCSFPSHLGFISELLGKEPGCLSVSKFALVSFMKAEWEVNICARACSKSTFFSEGGSLVQFDGVLF